MAEAAAKKTDVGTINSDVGIITPTTPLRLEVAARLAFPDGSMKLAGLRREIARGRLDYEVIANKHYTTLADIEVMRQRCRVRVKGPAFTAEERAGIKMAASNDTPSGSSSTEEKKSPPGLLRARISQRLQKRQKSSSPST